MNNLLLQDFITLFLGLVVEAFPFLVLGVGVSTAIALLFKEETLLRLLPKNTVLAHFVLSLSGILLPVCECGNVPVVRRLLSKGFSVSQALTFLLAAPIVNPITFYSTLVAFSFDPAVAYIRIGAAVLIANAIGLIFSLAKDQNKFLTAKFYDYICEHDHDHDHHKFTEAFNLFQREFVEVAKMLIIGALIATAYQVFIPRELVAAIGSNPVLSIIAMLALAFIVSICANVDAFFALSYAHSFTLGSLLTFLTFGPMIDIKMLFMLAPTFRGRTLALIATLVTLFTVALGLSVNLFL